MTGSYGNASFESHIHGEPGEFMELLASWIGGNLMIVAYLRIEQNRFHLLRFIHVIISLCENNIGEKTVVQLMLHPWKGPVDEIFLRSARVSGVSHLEEQFLKACPV